MRGGRREGAGRKAKYGKTKVYRLPEAIEPQIMEILEKYKEDLDSVTESKVLVDKGIQPLSKQERKTMENWLLKNRFARSRTEARKAMKTPKTIKKTMTKYAHFVSLWDEEMVELTDRYVDEW